MLETPHVIVGAAIATKVGNPALAIPLAFASHFILDRIPHWNPHFYTETQKFGMPTKKSTTIAVGDEVLAIGTSLFIASMALPNYGQAFVILASCFAAVLPDQIKFPYFFLKNRGGFLERWTTFERSNQANAPLIPGVLTQVLTMGAALLWMSV